MPEWRGRASAEKGFSAVIGSAPLLSGRGPSAPRISAAEAARLAAPGSRIFVGGCCGEPSAVLDAVAADPDLWQGVVLTGAFIPGVNRRDLSSLGRATRVRTIFATEGLRPGRSAGDVALWPAHYTELWRSLSVPGAIDIAYFQVPPPRADGTIGFGIAGDFSPATVLAGARLVGIVNPNMPDVVDGPRLQADRFAAFVDSEAPLLTYDAGAPDPAIDRIAALIAREIAPGDTIQLGLGKVQKAVLGALGGHRDLGFHGGMISDPILPLIDAGVFARSITTGVALGSAALYTRCGEAGLAFRPVGDTHAETRLSRIERFVSINSLVEVDLFGQGNAEMLEGRQISGLGGLADFVRGARNSPGGRSILALPATSQRGTQSRIVAALGKATPVGVARSDIDCVVTEHGLADLRGADVETRAERLIAIAAPAFRDRLAADWAALQQGAARP